MKQDSLVPYEKSWISLNEQIELIKSRGLSDVENYTEELEKYGYYRLSGYWYIFRQFKSETKIREDNFFKDKSFKNVIDLYEYDQTLRSAVSDCISRIEVAFRSKIASYCCEVGDCNYLDEGYFDSPKQTDFISKFHTLYSHSKEDFVRHFKRKYNGDMPLWMSINIFDFGTLQTFYKMLPLNIAYKISDEYGIHPRFFASWLESIRVIRNITAHNSRLWNRNLVTAKPLLPDFLKVDAKIKNSQNPKMYGNFVIIAHLCKSLNFKPEYIRLVTTIKSFPVIQGIDLFKTGFPSNWEQLDFWKQD
jgi:abortive infection bacteriophage resistance protein